MSLLTTALFVALVAQAQSPATTPIRARDGDLILIEGGANVRVIRRREAQVRAVHSPAERWLIVMVDYAPVPGKPPDGGVDAEYTFYDVTDWTLGDVWNGSVVIEEYSLVGNSPTPSFGIALRTPAGLIQVLSPRDLLYFKDAGAAALVSHTGSSRGGGGAQPFDSTEARLRELASHTAQMRANLPSRGRDTRSGIQFEGGVTATLPGMVSSNPPPSPGQPVRVGGNLRAPRKVVHVDPITPAAAASAGITGMVILEIVIGTEGQVTDVKVLRSIPLLDDAAVAAVRQWRYEPSELNGRPVPVIMTVTVTFR